MFQGLARTPSILPTVSTWGDRLVVWSRSEDVDGRGPPASGEGGGGLASLPAAWRGAHGCIRPTRPLPRPKTKGKTQCFFFLFPRIVMVFSVLTFQVCPS